LVYEPTKAKGLRKLESTARLGYYFFKLYDHPTHRADTITNVTYLLEQMVACSKTAKVAKSSKALKPVKIIRDFMRGFKKASRFRPKD